MGTVTSLTVPFFHNIKKINNLILFMYNSLEFKEDI